MRWRAVLVVGVIVAAVVGPASPGGAVAGFGDAGAERFYTEAVQWMVDGGITTGTSDTCFSPEQPVTRGQAAAFHWRMEGEPAAAAHPFTDVVATYQQGPVSWLAAAEITTGTSPTTFAPDRTLTRGEAAALIWRLAGEPTPVSVHPFGDIVRSWQQDPVSWMAENDITTGTSDTAFSPDDVVTRGQIAAFLYRYKGEPAVVVDPDHPVEPACRQQVARTPPPAAASCVVDANGAVPSIECEADPGGADEVSWVCVGFVDVDSFSEPVPAWDCTGDVDGDMADETWTCTKSDSFEFDTAFCSGDVDATAGDDGWGCGFQYNVDFAPDYPESGVIVECSSDIDAGNEPYDRIDCFQVDGQVDCTGDLGIDGSADQWSCVLASLSCGPDSRATLVMLPSLLAIASISS